MRVAVAGATGNLGTSVLAALAAEPTVDSVAAIARRKPEISLPKVDWIAADITRDDLVPAFGGASAVIHLAWAIQPSRDRQFLREVNVEGSRRVLDAAAASGASSFIYASSVGTYAAVPPGEREERRDESHSTAGIETSIYSSQKAEVERILDEFERRSDGEMRIVRMRPALIFKREASSEIRRFFAGPFLPNALLRKAAVPVVPLPRGLRFQCVHSDDVARAFVQATVEDVSGAFNLAAEPQLSGADLASALGGRQVEVSPRAIRALAGASWKARLQPTSPGWVDMGMGAPAMDTSRARRDLGWEPRTDARSALEELIGGLADGAGFPTPPLHPRAGGRFRLGELRSGVGSRQGVRPD